MLATLRREIGAVVRSMRRTPGVALGSVLLIALVTGPTAILASFFSAATLAPLRIERPAEVQIIDATYGRSLGARPTPQLGLSYPDFLDLRQAVGPGQLAAALPQVVSIGDLTREQEHRIAAVTDGYFELLGVQLIRGATSSQRRFDGAGPQTIVLSYQLWKNQFRRDETVIGRSIRVNGQPFTVFGVASEGFQGGARLEGSDAWIPIGALSLLGGSQNSLEQRDARTLVAYFRSRTSSDEARLRSILRRVGDELATRYTASNAGVRLVAVPALLSFAARLRSDTLTQVLVIALFGMAFVVLLAAGSVASVQVAKAVSSQPDVAIRVALGASPSSLVVRPVLESTCSVIGGALLGLVIASICVRFVQNTGWQQHTMTIDPFTFLCVLVCMMITGGSTAALAALVTLRTDAAQLLRETNASASPFAIRSLNQILIVQLAIAFVLGSSAILAADAASRLHRQPLGFAEAGIVRTRVSLGQAELADSTRAAVLDRVRQALLSLDGVAEVSFAGSRLVSGDRATVHPISLTAGGYPDAAPEAMLVSESFFSTMGIRTLSGRTFAVGDRINRLEHVVINEAMARRFWKNHDPVGEEFFDRGHYRRRIVGVVEDSRGESLEEDLHTPRWYALPYAVKFDDINVYIKLRTGQSVDSSAIFARLRSASSNGGVETGLESLEDAREKQMVPFKIVAAVAGALALIALAIAATSAFGLTQHTLARRTLELGVRAALGATPSKLVRTILRSALRVTAIGIGLGFGIEFAAWFALGDIVHESLSQLLAGASTTVVVLLGAVGGAIVRPSWRVARREPATIFRS